MNLNLILEKLKTSEIWTIIITGLTIIISTFSFGIYVANITNEYEIKTMERKIQEKDFQLIRDKDKNVKSINKINLDNQKTIEEEMERSKIIKNKYKVVFSKSRFLHLHYLYTTATSRDDKDKALNIYADHILKLWDNQTNTEIIFSNNSGKIINNRVYTVTRSHEITYDRYEKNSKQLLNSFTVSIKFNKDDISYIVPLKVVEKMHKRLY